MAWLLAAINELGHRSGVVWITDDFSLIVDALTPSNVTLVGGGAPMFCEIHAMSGRLTDLRAFGSFTRVLGKDMDLVKLLYYLGRGIQKRNVE